MQHASKLGVIAENKAIEYLESGGYSVISRNWRKPWGEIDIIARKDGILVFVEVKAGRTGGFVPELHADNRKMHKVLRTALSYLSAKKIQAEQEWRIDVIAITLDDREAVRHLNHYENIEFS